MIPAAFDYLAPRTLEEALEALAAHGEDARLLAGGQSLLPLLKLRLARPKLLVDLRKISGLDGAERRNDRLCIGALATHYKIESSAALAKSGRLLVETAGVIGDLQVRNLGTIGGSLVHADPGSDWPAAILALGGELLMHGPAGERRIRAEDFFLGPMTTAIGPREILTEIQVPAAQRRSGSAYFKARQRASGFALVGVAVALRVDSKGSCEEIGIGVTGLADRPFRARAAEERLRGEKLAPRLIEEAAARVADGVEPLSDLHGSAEFRSHLARIYGARAIRAAAQRAR
ncbi:MAG TPA: xanthine dehydrogenase family protein subunit M [candidate division Zixibacteria bacterium]|nr:xanthine dehydrogenase family protein subunit M [candidate division Zixibacteria bacterium]